MKGDLRWVEDIEMYSPLLSAPLGIVRDSILFCIFDSEELACHHNSDLKPSRTYTDATTRTLAFAVQHECRHMESSTVELRAPVGSLWSSPQVQTPYVTWQY